MVILRLNHFGNAKIEDLDSAVPGKLDVGWLQIAMNDPFGVRGFNRGCDLDCDCQRFINGWSSADDSIGERFSLDQFHNERTLVVNLFEPVNSRNIRGSRCSPDTCRIPFTSFKFVGPPANRFMAIKSSAPAIRTGTSNSLEDAERLAACGGGALPSLLASG
jgi:hypothetical protein